VTDATSGCSRSHVVADSIVEAQEPPFLEAQMPAAVNVLEWEATRSRWPGRQRLARPEIGGADGVVEDGGAPVIDRHDAARLIELAHLERDPAGDVVEGSREPGLHGRLRRSARCDGRGAASRAAPAGRQRNAKPTIS
jgi:hypothetical protein